MKGLMRTPLPTGSGALCALSEGAAFSRWPIIYGRLPARVVLCVMKRCVRAATGFVPRPPRLDLIERGHLLATVILPWRIAGARPLPLIDALGGGQRKPGLGSRLGR